jgi:REP element-mobilizing transposase RayT
MECESSSGKRGGARKGAGRKKSRKRHDSPHRARPSLSAKHPVHVVLRTQNYVPRLRVGHAYRALRRTLNRYMGRDDFRVVHISIQHNHLHLLIEAANRRALSRCMQSFAINAARAIQVELGIRGKVFAYRYHATQIRTPFHARHALAYILNNWRRHREDLATERTRAASIDPYASGPSFDGWAGGKRFAMPADYTPLPVSPPRTELLRFDWTLHGLIDVFECPGPVRFLDQRGVFDARSPEVESLRLLRKPAA